LTDKSAPKVESAEGITSSNEDTKTETEPEVVSKWNIGTCLVLTCVIAVAILIYPTVHKFVKVQCKRLCVSKKVASSVGPNLVKRRTIKVKAAT